MVNKDAPLEDVMAAMDVVDTLRHQQDLAERELDNDSRRERFMTRLKELYQAQGIDVPDHVLEQGIDALEEKRFEYTPVEPSWRSKLAYLWVTRSNWGKPIGFFALLCCVLLAIYVFVEVLPDRQLRAGLPEKISSQLVNIKKVAQVPELIDQAESLVSSAEIAIGNDDYGKASDISEQLSHTLTELEKEYTIRVISRANEQSGIWRVPPNNESARNYYLIVEAIDKSNNVVKVSVLNQENNESKMVSKWGLRVSEAVFYQIASDKNDDGIIQKNQVGVKNRGFLEPDYSINTSGATITEW